MRQQIRLIISPAQIGPTIAALDAAPNKTPETIAFSNYLKQKQLSISLGQTAIAYVAKPKASMANNLGFDIPEIPAGFLTPENVSVYADKVILAGTGNITEARVALEEINMLTMNDRQELKAWMKSMFMEIPPGILVD